MKPRQRKLSSYVLTTSLVLVGLALTPAPAQAAGTTMEFGVNIGGIEDQTNAGIKPNYAVLWAGPWTIDNWGYFDGQLATLNSRGITPVIQFYYWGNDLNWECWNNGCWSHVHGHWKNQAGWSKLADQLAQHLNSKMGGKKVVIVIETEFNKGNMGTSETLDAGLAAKAWHLRNNYDGAVIALGFGNWGHSSWGVFDRAAAASHEMGLQGMRGSTRDSVSSYTGLPAALLQGAQELKNRYGKPVLIHDIAVSSYPEPDWLKHQATVIKTLFTRIPELEAAGVHALIYRGVKDNPGATTAEYYGQAERHFGFRWASNNTAKPAYHAWKNGILAERGAASTTEQADNNVQTETTNSGSGGFTPRFQIKAPNEWWQEVFIQDTTESVWRVDVRRDGGAWQPMTKRSWGAWASSYNTKAGTKVEFLAHSSAGTAQSMPFTWMNGQLSQPTAGTATASSTPTTSNPAALHVPSTGSAFKEAETFVTRNGGSAATRSGASGGKTWILWSNSHISQPLEFAAGGTYEIRVRAQGQLAQGVRPHMDVHLDGTRVLGADPAGGYWSDYVGKVTYAGPTSKTIKIAFTNDAKTSTEDRNLWLDRLEVRRIA